jgi:hypothetical protein
MVGAHTACDASPPVATLIIGRGSKGLGVELTRGGGGRFMHCIDMEPVEETAHRRHPHIDMAAVERCSRVPIAAPHHGITVAG